MALRGGSWLVEHAATAGSTRQIQLVSSHTSSQLIALHRTFQSFGDYMQSAVCIGAATATPSDRRLACTVTTTVLDVCCAPLG